MSYCCLIGNLYQAERAPFGRVRTWSKFSTNQSTRTITVDSKQNKSHRDIRSTTKSPNGKDLKGDLVKKDVMKTNTIRVSINGVGWSVSIRSLLSPKESRSNLIQSQETTTKILNPRDQELVLNVGFAHSINIAIPATIEVKVRPSQAGASETHVELSSTEKVLLGDFAAQLMRIRPWNVYTGQGIIRLDRIDHLIRRRGKRK